MRRNLVGVVVLVVLTAFGVFGAEGGAVAGPGAGGAPGTGPCASDPPATTAPLLPERLEVPIPFPVVTQVPYPAPVTPTTRIAAPALPANPCTDPCPDLTDGADQLPGGLSSDLGVPQIGVKFTPFHLGIPVPGPDAGPLPERPPVVHPATESATLAAARPAPRVGAVTTVAKETGASSVNRTDKRWQVNGTDLGIMWESEPGKVAVAFGDTVGRGFHPPGGQGEDWRSNVLAFSTDRNLSDGMTFDSMVQDSRCHAAEILSSRKLDNVEITTIPTSGFAIGSRQYLSYMSIRTWNSIPGTMFTNHGGIAYSDDGGQNWTKDPYAQWDNIFGLARFQVSAMVPQGGYVYMFGTPNTRLGEVGLARVPADQVLNKSAYQYWSDGSWTAVGGAGSATPILSGPAGELSVRYDETRARWQMTYLDTSKAAITLRESDAPQGSWSESVPLVGIDRYPELYGGFIHPWSTATDLYFTVSTWSDYNVFLMHAELQ
ncbi:DUF4185 domain-containing protein [Rhodococcus spelaei]|uniref:DUF4185 domain-containing protein n=1 Tax=Rhodococcus spelaei TaxID=2546320 RepID=A0A541BQF4_9NOCA|nr:DUF4185 domain-containing protein [Rhodococcus spelaei]TQF74577.1 DUF4185 domain-containing protein [Rhodococcus spelaei]